MQVCQYSFMPPQHRSARGGQSLYYLLFVYCGGSDATHASLQQNKHYQQTIQHLIQILTTNTQSQTTQNQTKILDLFNVFCQEWKCCDSCLYFDSFIIIIYMKGEGNIKVFCRFRPFNAKQIECSPTRLHRINKKTQLIIKDHKSEGISFMFDHVFDMDSTQQQVFENVGDPVLNNILDGFNGTIMAYGQTSSGKTHTMQGYDLSQKDNRGIMPRIIESLFSAIEKSPENVQFKLKVAIFEIYMQKIRDLLDSTKSDLKIRQNKQGYYIQNLTEVYVGQKMQLFRIISIGQKNRMTCSTNMNQHSSRSHLIFLLTLNQTSLPDGASKTSKLFLIDLAGSEKISKTGAQGKVLQQAKKINLSLTNLGKVIKSLSQKGEKGHIPYRDSKLTRVLKDSLGGNSKTTLIVTCSPHQMHLPETISTLRFGQNAQKVKNKPKINKQLTVQELQRIIQKFQLQIKQKDSQIKFLQDYVKDNLKEELPIYKPQQNSISKQQKKTQQLQQKDETEQIIQKNESNIQVSEKINEQVEERIKLLEQQLSSYQSTMKIQMDKYYQLKKEYHDLRDHLTSILTENIELKQQMQEKNKKSYFTDKNISANVNLLKMILGEVFSLLDQQTKNQLVPCIQQRHWYQKIMEEGVDCIDFWHKEREKVQKQLQQSRSSISQSEDHLEDFKIQKSNEKAEQLEKLGILLEQYKTMVAHQTHWKAQCQLYERNLRKKQEDILKLEKEVEKLQQLIQEMYIYDENDDAISVKSNNRLVKPLKGGFLIR